LLLTGIAMARSIHGYGVKFLAPGMAGYSEPATPVVMQ
jgi:hypothetical protein